MTIVSANRNIKLRINLIILILARQCPCLFSVAPDGACAVESWERREFVEIVERRESWEIVEIVEKREFWESWEFLEFFVTVKGRLIPTNT